MPRAIGKTSSAELVAYMDGHYRTIPDAAGRVLTGHSMGSYGAVRIGTKAALASAAAWSPNPQNPPLYYDLPSKGGEFQPAIAA